jgi:hypothetical protein
MMRLIAEFIEHSPAGSLIVAEVPDSFDVAILPVATAWQVRTYPPVQLALFRKPPLH